MGKRDITGKKFNHLIAIKDTGKRDKHGNAIWLFKCDCGNMVEKRKSTVINGNSKTCGKECSYFKRTSNDIAGQRFNHLVAIEDTGKRDKHAYSIWLFKCDCGNFVEKTKNSVTKKGLSCCGRNCVYFKYKRIKPFERFNHLIAIENTGKKYRNSLSIWLYKCDCGNEIECIGTRVTNGIVKSCGDSACEYTVKKSKNEKPNHLTAIKNTGKKDNNGRPIWLFKCDCGNFAEKPKPVVDNGYVRHCGVKCPLINRKKNR